MKELETLIINKVNEIESKYLSENFLNKIFIEDFFQNDIIENNKKIGKIKYEFKKDSIFSLTMTIGKISTYILINKNESKCIIGSLYDKELHNINLIKQNDCISISEYKNGNMEGLTFFLNFKKKDYYFGYTQENYKSGFGLEKQVNDFIDIYIGYYLRGKFNKIGLLYTPKFMYYGGFLNDRLTGICQILLNNKARYFGEIVDGNLEGKGVYFFHDNTNFEGSFKNNLANGPGKIIYPNGDTFEGIFKNNSKHGESNYKSKCNQRIFCGFYDDGQEILEKSFYRY